MTKQRVKRAPARAKVRKAKRPARTMLRVKRAYDPPAAADGLRILIDRLWPRGISKEAMKLDLWAKEISPSTALRQWYGHKPERLAEFRRRYRAELAEQKDSLKELRARLRGHTATLLTATRELDLSHAGVLCEVLRGRKTG
ncbi:MAG: hypothetical protein GHHEDOFH_01027 [Pseudorhodoplanes sp.]|jgi:uncharacterized protein YeaO (DUF488 family)|nr:hypothetical protein [Pseudorhodoplanes sp.]GIK81912.1 MAG: hypothetical protein BroJett024_30170 [Alphaproteobacteria bacterium]